MRMIKHGIVHPRTVHVAYDTICLLHNGAILVGLWENDYKFKLNKDYLLQLDDKLFSMRGVDRAMRAMILAAGYGERMRPLTDHCPKPLLTAGDKALIEYQLLALRRADIEDVVINVAHMGEQIEQRLGDGSSYDLSIQYSRESSPLETAGGIANALELLGEAPFLVINSDIWCDYPISRLPQQIDGMAHLILVDNPAHHPSGDFILTPSGKVVAASGSEAPLTFSGIGIYRPELFQSVAKATALPLAPLLIDAMRRGEVTGAHHQGAWFDIGTPERLYELDQRLSAKAKTGKIL